MDNLSTKKETGNSKDHSVFEVLFNLFVDRLPILTIIAIFIGYFHLDAYYRHFSIDIISYMSFADALFVITKFSIYVILMFLVWYVFIIIGSNIWYPLLVYFQVKKGHIFYRKMRVGHLRMFISFFFIFLLLCVAFLTEKTYVEDKYFNVRVILILCFLSFLSVKRSVVNDYLTKEMTSYQDVEDDFIINEHFNFVRSFWGLAISIFYLFGYYSSVKAEKIENYNELRDTYIEFDDLVVNPLGELYYLGKTESYVFLYSSTDSISIIRRVDQLKTIKRYKKGYIDYLIDSLSAKPIVVQDSVKVDTLNAGTVKSNKINCP